MGIKVDGLVCVWECFILFEDFIYGMIFYKCLVYFGVFEVGYFIGFGGCLLFEEVCRLWI